ncbi:Mitochondrial ribonuclease P protein 1-like protein [Armadillidium vulgare]|nr:Mitochondrial ribonuclease P protein 1-like protein [Armadillidium vulgare]
MIMKFSMNIKNSRILFNNLFRTFKIVSQDTLLSPNSEEIASLKKWIDMCKHSGEMVPSNVTQNQMIYLLRLPTEYQRKKYLCTLFKKESNWEKNQKLILESKGKKLLENEKRRMSRTFEHIKYGVWNNALFTRISKQDISNLDHQKLVSSMIYGQTIILDFFYENNLTVNEKNILFTETISICRANCKSVDPFNLMFFNAELNSETLTNIKGKLGKNFPLQIFENNYINSFPKEKLIYLTPDSYYVMKYVDPNAVYIIGAIEERGRNQPLSLAKSKRDGIKHQKLPLDRYVTLNKKKSLSTYLIFKILRKFRETGCWRAAFGEIPENYKPKFKD